LVTSIPTQQSQIRRALALVRPLFWRYRLRIASGILALIGVDLCQLWIPRVVKLAIDGLEAGRATPHALVRHGLVIILLALGVAIFRFLWRHLVLGFSRLMERDLRDQLFCHLLTLDRAFFQRRTTGDLMAIATNDLAAVQMAAGMGLVALIDSFVMTGAVLIFMIAINPRLTLIALSPLPILALLTKVLSDRLHRRFTRVQETFSAMTELARSTINAMRLVKIYTREEERTARFDEMGREYIRHNLAVAAIQGLLFPVSGLVANLSLFLVVMVGGRMAINSAITIGDFVAFISYLFMLVWPMMAIGWVTNLFQRGVTSLSRLQTILDERPLLISAGEGLRLSEAIRSIELNNLTFTYPGQDSPVLREISLTLDPGLRGLVGPTGSGKSTLCHLLARLYPVPTNTMRVNGEEINRLELNDYRAQVAYAPQEPFLFSDTISANISFGRPAATQQEIEAVAMAVGIHDEIVNFTDGYGSRIGEKGVMLSGGQRQRISLARALLTKAAVLIIDDGLSAVDSGTERHIMMAIEEYAQERIVLMSSHRLTPLAAARSVIVLGEGKVIAIGSHQELMAQSDYYRAIARKQSEPAGEGPGHAG